MTGSGWCSDDCPPSPRRPDRQREHEVERAPVRVGRGEVVAGVAAARLLALQRRLGDALGDHEHVGEVEGEVPAGVVLPVALHAELLGARLELLDLDERLAQLVGLADDPDQALHDVLEVLLDRVGVLAALHLERRQRRGGGRLHLLVGDLGRVLPDAVGVVRRVVAGAAPEHQQVRQRVAAEPVGAVHAAGHLTRGVQPLDDALLGVGVDLDPAHDVVAGRPDLHRLRGDVDVGELLELVVHRRQPAPDELGAAARGDVEEDAAVR